MTTTRLAYAYYYLTIMRASNSKGNGTTTLVKYTILNHASKNVKVYTIVVGNTRSN